VKKARVKANEEKEKDRHFLFRKNGVTSSEPITTNEEGE